MSKLSPLRLMFLLGALYDLALVAGMDFAPRVMADILGVSLPSEMFHFRMNAFLLLPIAGMYFLAYLDPKKYRGNVALSVFTRLGGGAFILSSVVWSGEPRAYVWVGGVDFFFGLWHLAFWAKYGRR